MVIAKIIICVVILIFMFWRICRDLNMDIIDAVQIIIHDIQDKLAVVSPVFRYLKYITVTYIGIGVIFGIVVGMKSSLTSLFSVSRRRNRLKYFLNEESQKAYNEQQSIFSKKCVENKNWRTFKAVYYNDEGIFGKDKVFEIASELGLTSGSLIFKNQEVRLLERLSKEQKNKIISYAQKKNYLYEKTARKSYFMEACFEDVADIIKMTFSNLDKNMPAMNRGVIRYLLYGGAKIIAMYTLGLSMTIFFSAVLLGVSLILGICNFIMYVVAKTVYKIKLRVTKISYRCPSCKRSYLTPIYMCPNSECSILHMNLEPGQYGIFKRNCVCGKVKIPLTASVKGYIMDSSTDKSKKEKIRIKDIENFCPYCDINQYSSTKSALSRPLSIQLIGVASAGKTTFKVAYVHDFLENEAVQSRFEYDEWPDENSKKEYDTYDYYYKGNGVLAATQTGTGKSGEDITTFSFRLSHKKMSADRLIQIYDMPGERFQEGYAKEGWNNYTFSEGAVFLLDPYSLSNVREENKDIVDNPAYTPVDMNDLINSFIKTLRQLNLKMQNNKFVLPVALSINKADTITLRKQVGKFAVDNLMKMYPDVFKERHVAMDYACRCFLQKNEGENFIINLDNNFANVHFFSSSPYGSPNAIKFKPENVMEIMRWLLVRADKEFGGLWTWDESNGREELRDLTDGEKKLYLTHREYYENAVKGGSLK